MCDAVDLDCSVMECVGIVALVMVAATIGVHLGLPQAIAGVVAKVCKCHKCLTFWSGLVVLVYIGCPLLEAALLSLFAAYMSHWVALLLILWNKIYEKCYERFEKFDKFESSNVQKFESSYLAGSDVRQSRANVQKFEG